MSASSTSMPTPRVFQRMSWKSEPAVITRPCFARSFPEMRRLRRVVRRIEDFETGEPVLDQLVDDRLVLEAAGMREHRMPAARADHVDRLLGRDVVRRHVARLAAHEQLVEAALDVLRQALAGSAPWRRAAGRARRRRRTAATTSATRDRVTRPR